MPLRTRVTISGAEVVVVLERRSAGSLVLEAADDQSERQEQEQRREDEERDDAEPWQVQARRDAPVARPGRLGRGSALTAPPPSRAAVPADLGAALPAGRS